MPDYFLVHDAAPFDRDLRPVLGECYRLRSFAPARRLAATWSAASFAYADRYHLAPEEMLLPALPGLPFDRAVWRTAVGEALIVTAVELPEFPPHLESLEHFLASSSAESLSGSRDLRIGPVVYRPDHAKLNGPADVARIAEALALIDPGRWRPDSLPDADEDAEEELSYARQWFAELLALYRRCALAGRLIVLEKMY